MALPQGLWGEFRITSRVRSVTSEASCSGSTRNAFASWRGIGTGVACLSGTAFGPQGEGYLRLSYANSIQNLRDALETIEASLPEIPRR